MFREADAQSRITRDYLVVVMIAVSLIIGMNLVLASDTPSPSSTTFHVGVGYDYTTIMSAVDAASMNDKIVVHPGTYKENVILDKKLELHGTDMNTTIIDGNGATALTVTIDGCKVSGLYLTGGLPIEWSGEEVWTAGLEIRSDRNEVYGCYMQNNFFGLLMRDSDDNWIHDSISEDNRHHGVFFSGASQNRFDNFHCYANDRNGFSLFVSPDNDFYHCRSEKNDGNGWEIVDSEREYVRFSTSTYNGRAGFRIIGSFDTNSIENCVILGNVEDGMWISSEEYPNIENCTIAENGKNGVKLSNSLYQSKARIFNNLIMNNSAWAVEIDPGTGWCLIVRNDLINNNDGQTPQIFDNGDETIFNLGETGNHWDDWTSPDADSNGIVDVPYGISGAASNHDEHPSTVRFTNHSYRDEGGTGPFAPSIIREVPDVAVVDEMYTVYFNAVDKDTPIYELTWGYETSAQWLEMNENVLKGRPSVGDVGTYNVKVWVTDGTSTDEFVFKLDVLIDPYSINGNEYPPSITSDHISEVPVGFQYVNTYSASDPDTSSEDLVWSVTTTARFLAMEDNVLKGMPSSSDIGAFTVSIIVDDGDYQDISSFTLIVHPPDIDDDVYEPELIDIEERSIEDTGEMILSVKDLTEGKVDFIEFEWYIDGILAGSNSSLVVDLSQGLHTIILRARALGNDWYETTKEVKVQGVPDNKKEVDQIALIIVILLMVMIISISVYLAFSRKRRRSSEGARPFDGGAGSEITSEVEEEAEKRGPYQFGPRSSLEEEYSQINREALSWKRPSRFTMERSKMHDKLKMKYDEGEIDDKLHRELAEFINDHFQGGNG
jgi:parallel beta-helix repeat protein